jgi:type VII secretion-associated serine protease mycosin
MSMFRSDRPSSHRGVLRGAATVVTTVLATLLATGVALAPVMIEPLASPAYAAACGQFSDAPLPERPWPLRRLRPDRVWPVTRGAGVTVAVIDSGVSDEHPVLAGRLVAGRDMVDPSGDGTCDNAGHGTMIAGIIAGQPTEASGFHGMAPDARIMPVRVLASRDQSFDEQNPRNIADAILYAVDNGADVINLSLTTAPIPELEAAVEYALSKDVVLVAAAGNEGSSRDARKGFPAAYDGVLAVAGVGENGEHVSTSTTGDYVDVAAPGLRIEGPAPQGGGYLVEPDGGTSFAAGYVSGVAALVRAAHPDLTAEEVVDRIIRTADRPAHLRDDAVGAGVVNPYWAVLSEAGTGTVPEPPAPLTVGPPAADAMQGVRVAAAWTALVAVVLSGLILGSVSVVRNGRRRHWRPGRDGLGTND